MKVFRFMSIKEFRKYMFGQKLVNTTNHHFENNMATNSVGFCFFNLTDLKPEIALHMVSGIVSCQICAIFEVDKEKLQKTWGRYVKFSTNENLPMNIFKDIDTFIQQQSFICDEYCTQEYEKSTFKLIAFAVPEWYNTEKWKWSDVKDANL